MNVVNRFSHTFQILPGSEADRNLNVDAGGSYVRVADSHGDTQNADPALLDGRTELIRAWPRRLGMMEGVDSSFAAAVFIGYHASEGTPASMQPE